jgi:hypothetical protein
MTKLQTSSRPILNSTKVAITTLFILCYTIYTIPVFAQPGKSNIPFSAVPYYSYQPLTITIGKYKKELLTNDITKMIALENRISVGIDSCDIESIYFLSIRLYDLGKKDDAFYWFHTAKARALIFMNMLDPRKIGGMGSPAFELEQLFGAINELVGEYMNGYGFNDVNKGVVVFEKVKSKVKNIHSFKNIYKNIVFLNDSNLEKEKKSEEEDLAKTIDYMNTHKAEIKKQRIENGTQDKY